MLLVNASEPNVSLNLTTWRDGFGTSIPTLSVQGIGAKTLIDLVLSANAISCV